MLKIFVILIGSMSVTSYRSVPEQTDDSPFITSIGERVHPHGVAVSRDLLRSSGGPFSYGDTLYIESIGFKVVNDTMHIRHKRALDVWVATLKDEKAFHARFKGKKLRVWLVKPNLEEIK